MTLDEAITIYENNATYERTHGNLQGCLDFRQLAEWLKDYKQLREQTKWTLVSDGLPKEHICDDGYVEPSDAVLITTKSGDTKVSRYWGNRWSKITEEAEGRSPEYYDWIEAELWENDVIAWMPLPEPYKAERSGEE